MFRNNVDPVSVLDIGELKQVFTRTNHFMPKQRPGEYEFRYKRRLAEVRIQSHALHARAGNSGLNCFHLADDSTRNSTGQDLGKLAVIYFGVVNLTQDCLETRHDFYISAMD